MSKFSVGTEVQFLYDGLEATGTIIKTPSYSSTYIILLDKDCFGGWEIEYADGLSEDELELYKGGRGWNVEEYALKLIITQLGNIFK